MGQRRKMFADHAAPAAKPRYTGDITGCHADAVDLASADTTSEYWQMRIRFILCELGESVAEKREERHNVESELKAMRARYRDANPHDRAALKERAESLKARLWSIEADELPRLERLIALYDFYRQK